MFKKHSYDRLNNIKRFFFEYFRLLQRTLEVNSCTECNLQSRVKRKQELRLYTNSTTM